MRYVGSCKADFVMIEPCVYPAVGLPSGKKEQKEQTSGAIGVTFLPFHSQKMLLSVILTVFAFKVVIFFYSVILTQC